jgi:hypothetical protein
MSAAKELAQPKASDLEASTTSSPTNEVPGTPVAPKDDTVDQAHKAMSDGSHSSQDVFQTPMEEMSDRGEGYVEL